MGSRHLTGARMQREHDNLQKIKAGLNDHKQASAALRGEPNQAKAVAFIIQRQSAPAAIRYRATSTTLSRNPNRSGIQSLTGGKLQ